MLRVLLVAVVLVAALGACTPSVTQPTVDATSCPTGIVTAEQHIACQTAEFRRTLDATPGNPDRDLYDSWLSGRESVAARLDAAKLTLPEARAEEARLGGMLAAGLKARAAQRKSQALSGPVDCGAWQWDSFELACRPAVPRHDVDSAPSN
jgi:hypothetical protein